jgi:hypothetical protein
VKKTENKKTKKITAKDLKKLKGGMQASKVAVESTDGQSTFKNGTVG